MRVIGTAGHVDHGKSTLVKALTGINPDRLKEEQQREMTIELGFAWMVLPDGGEVGIVDVPGHRDFIENMLAGVGGIDAVLFVVAADEGVMPQTKEHLAILDILQVPRGVVVLTKTDLAEDSEWLDLVEEDLKQEFQGTVLQDAPIVRVSARHAQGLEELTRALQTCLQQSPERLNRNRPRLPIDRVFTISGFGTIVTGTLLDGILQVGDEIEILPSGIRGRIRGLQTHKKKEESAEPGSRTAVNVTGIDVEDIKRGDMLVKPRDYSLTRRMDVHFQLLKDASLSVRHNMDVKVFLGAAETPARLRLLGKDQINPGEEGWLQLELENPMVAIRRDRYILRRPSPGETLGGGEVIEPHPARRHKRFSKETLTRLEKMMMGTPEELLIQASLVLGPASQKDLVEKSALSEQQAADTLDKLRQSGDMIDLAGSGANQSGLLITTFQWDQEIKKATSLVGSYHIKFPLRLGIPREEMKSKMGFSARVFNMFLTRWVQDGQVEEENQFIRLPGYKIVFSPQQKNKIEKLMDQFLSLPYSPPTVKESQEYIGEEVYTALLDLNKLIQLTTDVVFRMPDYQKLVDEIKTWLNQKETITVAQFRDEYQTSRRYALAFLEHLDQIGLTLREGDFRKLRKR